MKIPQFLSLLFLLFLSTHVSCAPDSRYDSQGIDQYGHSRYTLMEEDSYYQGWINLPWESDGKQFLVIREAVNRLAAKKQLAPKLAAWEKQALDSPNNASHQFRYAFAAYRLALTTHKLTDLDRNLVRKLGWHLSLPKNQRSYQYDRLRFLLHCEGRINPSMIPLGKRLQAKNPKDSYVNYWLSVLRSASGDLPYMESLVKKAKAEVDKAPNDPEKRIGLAEGYFQLWIQTKRRLYATKAVEQYKEFVRLEPNIPANQARREKIKSWIVSIPESQSHWEKNGIGKP